MNRETGSLWDPPPRRNVWLAAASALWLGASAAADPPPTAGWSHIGADAGGSRYTALGA